MTLETFLENTSSLCHRFFGTPFELRAIRGNQKRNSVYGTLRTDWTTNWGETDESLKKLNRDPTVFITLNTIGGGAVDKAKHKNAHLGRVSIGGSVKDKDISAYRWVLVDIDPVRKGDTQAVSSTDEEKESAWKVAKSIKAFLADNGFCDPVVCDSGNGYHLHYRVSMPNNDGSRALIKQFLAFLSDKFSTDEAKVDKAVFNPSRIIKLYGTVARKGEDDVEGGRPHRLSGFLEFPNGAELKINEPERLEAVAGKAEVAPRSIEVPDEGKQRDRVLWVREFMDTHGIAYWEEKSSSDEVKFFFEDGCPFDSSHGRKDAYVCVFPSGKAVFKCLHDSCANYGWHDFIKLYDEEHVPYRERVVMQEQAVLELLGAEVTTDDEDEDETKSEEEKSAASVKKKIQGVMSYLEYGKSGVKQSFSNFCIVLKKDPKLKKMFGINELTGLPENRKTGETWSDGDDLKVFAYLEKVYGFTCWEVFLRAVRYTHEGNRFNPVLDKLNALTWDGVSRLETSLIDYLNAEDTEYARGIAKMMFLGAVQRAFEPGCKFDNMVVLLGKQGCGKSTFVKLMSLDDKFFSDSVRGVGDREGAEQLRGAWVVEWGEMSAMKRARDAETIKLFISQQYDRYRPSYGRYVVTYPRRCIFVGTTNDPSFLSDRTGNRRFFPVYVGDGGSLSVHHKNAKHEFEQMMAEAVHLYKNGERVTEARHLENSASEIRYQCIEEDSREGIIQEWLNRHPAINTIGTRVIWDYALKLSDREMTRKDSREMAALLDTLPNWERTNRCSRMGNYGLQKSWVRKGANIKKEGVIWKAEENPKNTSENLLGEEVLDEEQFSV